MHDPLPMPPAPALARPRIDTATRWLLLACAVHLLLWGAMSARWAPVAPDDSLEQVLLSQEWRLDYGKHPPLPTWLLYGVARLAGPSIATTFVLGALCAVATMLLLFAYARPLVGVARAAVIAMLAGNVVYLNAGSANYNHNTLQLPLAVLAIMTFHRALLRGRPRDWALCGLACGAMMLAKFSAVILFAAFGAYLLWSGRWRARTTWQGVALAVFACAALVAPYELATQLERAAPQAPDAYAQDAIFPQDVSRLDRLKSVYGFASSQLAKVAPALIVFFAVRRAAPRAPARPAGDDVALGPFLAIVGFGPLVLTVVVAALTGARLLVNWGTTFHVLLTFWLVAAAPFAIDAPPAVVRRAALLTLGMQLLLWVVLTLNGGRLPNLNPTAHRPPPPLAESLPREIGRYWATHCGAAPLRYVVTDVTTGAALAVRYGGSPRVVDGTRPERARFFPDAARIAYGAVVVLPREHAPAAPPGTFPLDDLYDASTSRETLDLDVPDGRTRRYRIGLIAPAPAADPARGSAPSCAP